MQKIIFLGCLALPAFLSPGLAAAGTPCLLSGSADLVTVPAIARVGSGMVSVPDCSDLAVSRGQARALLRKPSGQGYYVDLSAGERLQDKLSESSSSGFFTRFRNMAKTLSEGNVTVQAGIKRDIVSDRVEGFPRGDVLAWKTPVSFNFLEALPAIESFELSDSEGRPVYQTQELKGAFTLPAGLVQAGRSYQWQLSAGGKVFKGSFRTLDTAASAQLAEELNRIEKDSALNGGERKALAAMACDGAGLGFDRDRLMAEVMGRHNVPGTD